MKILKNKIVFSFLGFLFVWIFTAVLTYGSGLLIQALFNIDFGPGGLAVLFVLGLLFLLINSVIYIIVAKRIFGRYSEGVLLLITSLAWWFVFSIIGFTITMIRI